MPHEEYLQALGGSPFGAQPGEENYYAFLQNLHNYDFEVVKVPNVSEGPEGVGFEYVPAELAPYISTGQPMPIALYEKYKDIDFDWSFTPFFSLYMDDYEENVYNPIKGDESDFDGPGGSGGGGGSGGSGGDGSGGLYQSLGAILNMGGQAVRDLAYRDPASFINLLATEAAGDTPVAPILRNFLMGAAPRLYALAGLQEISSGLTPDPKTGEMPGGQQRVTDIFAKYTDPTKAGEFASIGGKQGVSTMLKGIAASPNAPGASEQNPQYYFNDAFSFAAQVMAPTMTPYGAQSFFSEERRDLERAQFITAVAQGTFKGTPLEWLSKQGYF